jgi:tRNA pseudouridine38-40 synthase
MDRMAQASQCLIGTHDFSTFGRPPQGENRRQKHAAQAVRTVSQAEWRAKRVPSEASPGAPAKWGRFLTFDITANAFLYHMVRSLVGSLVLIGAGRLLVDEFEAMLLARDSSMVKQLAPAHGLCLMRVDYSRAACLWRPEVGVDARASHPTSKGVMQ